MIEVMIFTLVYGIFVLSAGHKWIEFVYDHVQTNNISPEISVFCGIVVIMFLPSAVAEIIRMVI